MRSVKRFFIAGMLGVAAIPFAALNKCMLAGPAMADDNPQPEMIPEPPPAEPPPVNAAPEPAYEPPPPGDFPSGGSSRSSAPRFKPGQNASDLDAQSSEPEEANDSIIKVPRPQPAKPRQVTAAESKAACAKYEGRFISYYSEIYRVEKCKRRQVQDPATLQKLMRGGTNVTEVESKIIAALPSGKPLTEVARTRRSCRQLEGKFVSLAYTDVYLVQKCHRRMFPDWETFMAFKKKKSSDKAIRGDIIPLTEEEFYSLEQGPDMPSAVDIEFMKQYDRRKTVDIIPIDEACRGVEGKIVSFYSKLYKVEKCRKREMDPETATHKNPNLKPKELTPEQWVSLPDGKSLKPDKPAAKQQKPLQYKPLPHTGE
jgi:hypothetical protein